MQLKFYLYNVIKNYLYGKGKYSIHCKWKRVHIREGRKKYANKLTMNPKYNEGDIVYIKDANGLLRQIKIIEAVKMFGCTHYRCIGYPKNVDELRIYPTVETYLDEIKNNIKYLSQE